MLLRIAMVSIGAFAFLAALSGCDRANRSASATKIIHAGAGVKRAGYNTVSDVTASTIALDGAVIGDESGEGAVPDHGDSGGPMINGDGELAGVVSNGVATGLAWHTTYFNMFSGEG